MKTKRASIEVFGIGQCSLDFIGKIQAYPPPDRKCEFSDMVIQGGGPVATALVALARWEVSCAFAGVLGDDLFGRMIKECLEADRPRSSRGNPGSTGRFQRPRWVGVPLPLFFLLQAFEPEGCYFAETTPNSFRLQVLHND